MTKLALCGGQPTIEYPLELYSSLGEEETEAVSLVMRSGRISEFIGAYCKEFYGGPNVRLLEERWSDVFQVKHSISVNSNTSGLIAALGAVGAGPGDEVIVPPWTMSATAIAPLFYGAVPIFADVEPDYFCLDPEQVLRKISPRTKAIIAVNLFGHPAELSMLRRLADERGIFLIEDNAQAPLAHESTKLTGTVGHIGVASLNYHKHIHTGEGGICTTNDSALAERLMLIRNHGENCVDDLKIEDITNLVGFNFRMTEISAAIGLCQLEKAKSLIDRRQEVAEYLSERVSQIDGLTAPRLRGECRNVYYLWGGKVNPKKTQGVTNKLIAKALAAEGCPTSYGYVEPLYKLPVFQRRIAIGKNNYPFSLNDTCYETPDCPVVERLNTQELIEFSICSYQLPERDIALVADCYEKVFDNLDQIKDFEASPQGKL